MVTKPPVLTRGVTRRITPVSKYSISLTTGASSAVTPTADRVATGTWSPTWISAVWLSSTISDGDEMMLRSVTLEMALSVTSMSVELAKK